MLPDRGLCNGLITHPEESCRLWCVVVCDLETSRIKTPWPALGHSAIEEELLTFTGIWYCVVLYGCETWGERVR